MLRLSSLSAWLLSSPPESSVQRLNGMKSILKLQLSAHTHTLSLLHTLMDAEGKMAQDQLLIRRWELLLLAFFRSQPLQFSLNWPLISYFLYSLSSSLLRWLYSVCLDIIPVSALSLGRISLCPSSGHPHFFPCVS